MLGVLFLIAVILFVAALIVLTSTLKGEVVKKVLPIESPVFGPPYAPSGWTVPDWDLYRQIIERETIHRGVDPCILAAVIMQESRFDPNAVNPSDPSFGIAQMMVPTANDYEPGTTQQDLMNPEIAIRLAAKHLQRLQGRLVEKGYSLLSHIDIYNVGEGNVLFKNVRNVEGYQKPVNFFYKEFCK